MCNKRTATALMRTTGVARIMRSAVDVFIFPWCRLSLSLSSLSLSDSFTFLRIERERENEQRKNIKMNVVVVVVVMMVVIVRTTFSLSDVSNYVELRRDVPVGNRGGVRRMAIYVPHRPGDVTISSPRELMEHVKDAWDVIVEENQAGLLDTKVTSKNKPPPMSEHEAWHHYKAGQNGVIDSGRFLISFGIVPSVQTGGSILHILSSKDDVEAMAAILDDPESRLEVDEERLSDGCTPLFYAVALGNIRTVKFLLKRNANPNHVARNGVTPLIVAASMGHNDIVVLLLEYDADVNYLHPFARTTALHFASEMGRVDVIETLCTRGQAKRLRKKTGGMPIHTAADTNQSKACESLLEHCGSNVNELLNGDTTPLYLAAQRGFSEVIHVLSRHGANIDYVMPRDRFQGELMRLGKNHDEMSEFYYSAKNTEIGNGATSLHAAVENGHLNATCVLLELGAKQLTSMEGVSPLLLSLQYRHPDIALRLLDVENALIRAHVNTPCMKQDGIFPLFVASGYGYERVVRKLLDLGANPTLRTRHGHTALDYSRRHPRILKLLRNAATTSTVAIRNDEL